MTLEQMIVHIRAANGVARNAAAHDHHPFGALLVGPDNAILMRQGNINTVRHAETELARRAANAYSRALRRDDGLSGNRFRAQSEIISELIGRRRVALSRIRLMVSRGLRLVVPVSQLQQHSGPPAYGFLAAAGLPEEVPVGCDDQTRSSSCPAN